MDFGIVSGEIGADGIEIGDSLRRSDAGLQVPQDEINPGDIAGVQDIPAIDLLLVDHGKKDIGICEQESPVELRWSHADDRERMLVDLNDAAHDRAVVLKTGVPAGVADHKVGRAVGTALIGGVEKTAQEGLNAERVEVVASDFK